MILNQSQAEAVYSAMIALNNVSGHIARIELDGSEVRIRETPYGRVFVDAMDGAQETYADQTAFAAAYGLQG